MIRGALVELRPVVEADALRLLEILSQPLVAQHWGRYDAARVQADFFDYDDGVAFVILAAGSTVGLVQYAEETEPDYRHASIDIFLSSDAVDAGLGTDAVRTLARYLFSDLGHHRITIDPAADNVRAIRSYTKVGFRPVGVMRRYERGLDGAWHDNLLMDLLPEDLTAH